MHPWAEGRELWLGGVRFEGPRGLAGHSDGDAVCHAIADALLGAAALGDVGEHFPDTDPAVESIAGSDLLAGVVRIVAGTGLDAVQLRPHRDLPRAGHRPASRRDAQLSLADVLGVDVTRVSVKATRPEGLGLVGDGIGCLAVAVLA